MAPEAESDPARDLARLERRPAGHLVADHDRYDDHKLRGIAQAQAAGRIRQGDPFDVMAMVITMSMACRERAGPALTCQALVFTPRSVEGRSEWRDE